MNGISPRLFHPSLVSAVNAPCFVDLETDHQKDVHNSEAVEVGCSQNSFDVLKIIKNRSMLISYFSPTRASQVGQDEKEEN